MTKPWRHEGYKNPHNKYYGAQPAIEVENQRYKDFEAGADAIVDVAIDEGRRREREALRKTQFCHIKKSKKWVKISFGFQSAQSGVLVFIPDEMIEEAESDSKN